MQHVASLLHYHSKVMLKPLCKLNLGFYNVFSSMYLITTLVTFLAVWLILVGSQGTHMLYMAHYLMGPPRFCLRAPLLIQTRDAIGKWWRDCE